jgi:hypothetical protein
MEAALTSHCLFLAVAFRPGYTGDEAPTDLHAMSIARRYVLGLIAAVALPATALGAFALYSVSQASLPDEAEARAIFTGLHRDIYGAFDHDDEGAIYDVLARSVDGRLLNRIYAEVYEALVMRDQGGARAKLHEVEMLEARLLDGPPDPWHEPPRFRVQALWEVTSSLVHEGHEHVRVIEYEGLYTVARLEEGWRIVEDKILSQRPVPILALPEELG